MFYVSDQYVFPHTKEQSTNTDTPVKREPTAANAKGKRHSDHNKPKRATQKDKASTGARPKESAKDTRNGKGSWLSSIDLDHIRTDSRHSSTNPRQPEVWEELYDLYYRKGEEQPNLTISQFGNERRSPPRNYNNREPQQRSRSPRSCQSSPPAYRDTHHPRSRHATDYGKQSYASDSIYTYSSDSRSCNSAGGSYYKKYNGSYGTIHRNPYREANQRYQHRGNRARQSYQGRGRQNRGRDYYSCVDRSKIDPSRYNSQWDYNGECPKYKYLGWSNQEVYSRIREVNLQINDLTQELSVLQGLTPRKDTRYESEYRGVKPPRW